MASKTQEKQNDLARAIDAARAYAERGGMVVLEPVPEGFHANDCGVDVYVTVAVRRSGSGAVPVEPTQRQRARAARAGWRHDHIALHILSDDRALLRHNRAVCPD